MDEMKNKMYDGIDGAVETVIVLSKPLQEMGKGKMGQLAGRPPTGTARETEMTIRVKLSQQVEASHFMGMLRDQGVSILGPLEYMGHTPPSEMNKEASKRQTLYYLRVRTDGEMRKLINVLRQSDGDYGTYKKEHLHDFELSVDTTKTLVFKRVVMVVPTEYPESVIVEILEKYRGQVDVRFVVREQIRANWELKKPESTSVTVYLRKTADRVALVDAGPVQVDFGGRKVEMIFRHYGVTEEESRKLSVPADRCDKCGTKCNDAQGWPGTCKTPFGDRMDMLRKHELTLDPDGVVSNRGSMGAISMLGQGGEVTKFKTLEALVNTPPAGGGGKGQVVTSKGNTNSPFSKYGNLVVVKKDNKGEMSEEEIARWIKTNLSEMRRLQVDSNAQWRSKVQARVTALTRKTQKAKSDETAQKMFAEGLKVLGVGATQGVYEKGMKRSDSEKKMLAAVAALKYEVKGMKTKEPEWEELLTQVKRSSGEDDGDWGERVIALSHYDRDRKSVVV